MAVTAGGPVQIPRAFRSNDLGDLRFHQLVHDPEADADAQGQQSLSRCPDELAER